MFHNKQIVNLYLQVEDECGAIPAVIVQNKIDLIDQSVVDPWVSGTQIFLISV